MDAFFSVIRLFVGCGTLLLVLLIVVAHLPNSPVRTLLIQVCSWASAVLCGALVLSPIDPIPDFLFPLGFLDDAVALIIGLLSVIAAWKAGKSRSRPSQNTSKRLEVK